MIYPPTAERGGDSGVGADCAYWFCGIMREKEKTTMAQDEYEMFFQLLAEKSKFKNMLMEMDESALREIIKIVVEVLDERYP